MLKVFTCLALLSFVSSPALAKHHVRVAIAAPTFWSIFQPREIPRVKRVLRRTKTVRRTIPSNTPALGVGSDMGPSFSVVAAARSQIGNGAIYGRRSLWCARFMNAMLERTGHKGTGSDLASSFTRLPRTSLHVGAIAYMGRRGGGHVGIVSGITAKGDPVIVSGNHRHRVAESVYPISRIRKFVNPIN